MKIVRNLLLAAGFATVSSASLAQTWPDHPITMIVPYNPGGTTDILARAAAEAISAAVGQPVVVENKPGAGGVVGASLAARAAPDGYTLFFGNDATHVVQPLINPAVTYDPVEDFDGIATVADASPFVGVSAGLGIDSFDDFLTYITENDGLKYGTAGVGSKGQFSSEYLLMRSGGKAKHIPYPGSNDAAAAVMSGEVDFMVDPVVMNQAGTGKIKALAVLSPERHPNMPDVPTARELGHDFIVAGWFGLFAPKGTDPAIIAAIAAPLETLAADPAYREQVSAMGLLPGYRNPEETGAAVTEMLSVMGEIRDKAGIAIQ